MTQRLPSLTSLRWFAALLVFGTHVSPLIEGSSLEPIYDRVGRHGGVGVSFFFVLSGFVLAWTHRSGDSARAFYRRRFARVAPAYWASSVLAFAVIAGVESDLTPSRVARAMFSFVGLQAWVPDTRVYLGGNPVGWTLSVEMFFYAAFPVLVLLAVRMTRTSWLLGGVGLVAFTSVIAPLSLSPIVSSEFGLWALKISPPVRVSEFILGIFLALLLRSGMRIPHLRIAMWSSVAVAAIAYAAGGWVPQYLAVASLTLLPFCLVIASFAQRDLIGQSGWLHGSALIKLGQWSFCFYLVHQLVIRVIAGQVTITGGAVARLGYILGSLLLAVALSAAMYRFIEHPFERRLRGSPLRARTGREAPAPASA